MATAKFSFEGGTNGANVAAGAGASTGDTNFDVVNRSSGATNAYDNTHPGRGSLGLKIAVGATSATAYVSWTTAIGTQTTTYWRALCYFTGAPASNTRVLGGVGSASSRGNILINTNGKFIFTNAAGTNLLTSASLPLNAQFRLEAKFVADASVGMWEYKIWYDPRSVGAPDDTNSTAATQNMGGQTDTYRFGIGAANTNVGPYWLDDVAVSTVGYIGPEDPRVTGTASFFAKKASLDVVDRSAVSGGPILKKMRVAGTISETTTISGGPRTKKMRVAGNVTATTTISGAVRTKKMSVAGTISETTTISGAVRTKKMRVAGTVVKPVRISGDVHLHKMRIAGTIVETTTVSGGPTLKKMRVTGTIVETTMISGAVRMHKMKVFGGLTETTVIVGNIRTKKMQVHVNAVRPKASELLVFTPV